ncbi:MAG: CpaD family pilus assembly protein [Rhizomicrobium sp.]|nr:CpaD family pilus assembly protein [Rhizomicrobium sp.]
MMNLKDSLRVASVAAVLLAGSCAAPMNDGTTFSSDPAVNHPITVAPHFTALKLNFSAADAGLLPDDAARFEAFVADYASRGSGSISISAPQGSDAAAIIRYFGTRLFDMGVPRSRILVGTHDGADQRVEIGFIAYAASTNPCGDWSKNLGDTAANAPSPNFGCAVQTNIAAQIADPRDLIGMRAADPIDANRRAAVIGNYEQGKITSAEKSKDQSGAVADVDK